jgi:surface carbohydrate biosynthesis protein
MIKLFKLIINLFLAKWIFKRPKKKKILIYDREGSEIFFLVLKKNSFEILDTRRESVNIYILLYTVYNNGFLNLIKNYKINYIKIVSPKFVITIIDNNLSFYQLKDLFNGIIFISIQGGRRDNIFFDQCKDYYLKNNKRLSVDYFFVLGRNEIKRFDKYINAKFYPLGSLRNNYFILKEKID